MTVTRDAGALGFMCDIHVVVDGLTQVALSQSDRVTLYLTDGRHVLGARTSTLCGGEFREAAAEVSGERLAFRVGFGANGDLFISPTN